MLGLKAIKLGDIRDIPKNTIVYLPTDDAKSELKERYLYYLGILCIMLNADMKKVVSKSREEKACLCREIAWLYLRENDKIGVKRIGMVAKRKYSTVVVLSNNFKARTEIDKKARKIYDVFRNYVDNEKELQYVKEYEWN